MLDGEEKKMTWFFVLSCSGGLNYLHVCKPELIIRGNLSPKNIVQDDKGQLMVAGFGPLSLTRIQYKWLNQSQNDMIRGAMEVWGLSATDLGCRSSTGVNRP